MPTVKCPRIVWALVWAGLAIAGFAPASGAAAPADPRAAKVIADFLAAYERVASYQGRIDVVTHNDERSSHLKIQLCLEKPRKLAMTVLSSPEKRAAEGTKVVWFGEETVKVKTRFFGLPVTIAPRYDDERLLGIRHENMSDTSIVTAVAMTRHPGARFRYLRGESFIGRPMHVVEQRSPLQLPGIDHEVLWVDDQLKLPFVREMHDAKRMVYRVQVDTFEFDRPLPANAFTMD